ncbi:hypothetical protein CR513_32037, partial [Mucuna pruriens]
MSLDFDLDPRCQFKKERPLSVEELKEIQIGPYLTHRTKIDLNKACPKDPYPLPSINQLVDGTSDFSFLSFMDAYSGYNQIQMHP